MDINNLPNDDGVFLKTLAKEVGCVTDPDLVIYPREFDRSRDRSLHMVFIGKSRKCWVRLDGYHIILMPNRKSHYKIDLNDPESFDFLKKWFNEHIAGNSKWSGNRT